ncbi:conserved hypothetical protein [Methylobacterium sp. 4-46]|uniref:hypothetical protein n=1 Tax=unclassified Methylobacterium TaxID=2615210 RepID=UPI000152E18F|nr:MULTISPECIES: hypothetical protein [Methylobacterium]ACA18273.1 conserved hypothetical protein [Methylobacterium sp. 4-46]WFT77572.1 hypothetical protein QA634_19850 [Methylobacterium nodulans]
MLAQDQLRDAYNVFLRKHKPGVCCAVREDMPVPAFLAPENWSYGYTARSEADVPVGFQPWAAREAADRLGFYLFQDICA